MPFPLVKMGIYNTYTDVKMLAEAGSILDTIEKNAPIAELAAQVTDTRAKYKLFVEAYNEAASKSIPAIVKKRDTKLELTDNLIKLAIGVNFYAMGNEEILSLTGMPMEKKRASFSRVVLQKPEGLTATNCGNSGCVMVKLKMAIGAKSFMYQWTAEPVTDGSVWVSEGGSKKSYQWTGFKPGTIIWFRVIAIGTGDIKLISDAVSCMVI